MSWSSAAHSRRASRRCCTRLSRHALLLFPPRVPGNRRTSPLPARPPSGVCVRARHPRGRQARRRGRRFGVRVRASSACWHVVQAPGVSTRSSGRHCRRGATDRQSQRVRADHHQRPWQLSIGDHSGTGRRRRLRPDRRLWTRGWHSRAGERGASAFSSAWRHVRATRAASSSSPPLNIQGYTAGYASGKDARRASIARRPSKWLPTPAILRGCGQSTCCRRP